MSFFNLELNSANPKNVMSPIRLPQWRRFVTDPPIKVHWRRCRIELTDCRPQSSIFCEMPEDRNTIKRRAEVKIYQLVFSRPRRWRDMAYNRIKSGNPSVCTWAKANNCTVPATSVALASVFHRASVFGEEGANARLESWDPEFIFYLLCSLQRQTHNSEIKCNLSPQRQVLQFDPSPEVGQWRLDISNFSKSMALFTEHATRYQAYCCLSFSTDANTPFHIVQSVFVTTMFTYSQHVGLSSDLFSLFL